MAPYEPFQPGELGVDVRTFDAVDPLRKRRFPIDVWQPATTGSDPPPLVVYSHPSGGDRRAASYLCSHLASHGYVVAALDHSEVVAPELVPPAEGSPDERVDWARQTWVPARVPDIRFLIDRMLDPAATDTVVDPKRIGIVGHSFGGWTALASPERDGRVRAVVALAPAGVEPAPPGTIPVTLSFQWSRDVPTMYLVAGDDTTLPLAGMHQIYNRTPVPRQMIVLHHADHLHFVDDVEGRHEAFRAMPLVGPVAEIQRRMRPIGDLCTGDVAHRFVEGLTVAHFDAALRHRAEARRFLERDVAAELARHGIDAAVVAT